MNEQIISRLRNWFAASLHVEVPSADADLLETGLMDSLQIVELLMELEQQFGFKASLDDIDLDDLRSLERIAALVAEHASPTALAAAEAPAQAQPAAAPQPSPAPRMEISMGAGGPMPELAGSFFK